MLLLKLADNAYAFAIWIAGGIYKIAAYAFEVFIILSNGQIIDSSSYQKLIDNFYILIGIVLLFFLAFSLLKGMVNPDDSKSGTSAVKNVIINLVTSVLIMAILPTIFGFLYDFQTSFITRYNVIGRFFGYGITDTSETIGTDTKELVETGSYRIVNGVFTAFMNVNIDNCDSDDLETCQKNVYNKDAGLFGRTEGDKSFAYAIAEVNRTGNFAIYNDFSANITDGEVDFQWFLSIIAGLLLVYVAASFCFDMGLRLVKLVFYQVIAPIPIFGRVLPDGPLKGSFEKWIKLVLTCYLEVYVRILVFYFAIWLCLTILNAPFLTKDLSQFSVLIQLLTKAFLLMGIIMFMKQAPKLISDVTGLDSSNMKLGIKDKFKDGGFFTAGAAVGSSITAGTRNLVNKWGNKKNWQNGEGKVTARSVARNLFGGVGSAIAGTGSGLIRGGSAGWKAGSFSDMKAAAGKGAKDTIDARDKRAAYRASHGGNVDTGAPLIDLINGGINVTKGHIGDAFDTAKRWAGVNNIQALQEENAAIDLTSGKIDKVVDSAKDLIKSQFLAKGKNFSFGVSGSDSKYGISFNADTYRKLSDLRDRASTNQGPQSLKGIVSDAEIAKHIEETNGRETYTADEIQRIFGKYENDYAKEVANTAFMGSKSYGSYINAKDADGKRIVSYDEEAAFSSVRSAAEDARHQLERSFGSRVVAKANEISESLGAGAITVEDVRTGDLKVTGDTPIDKFGTAAKIIKNENLTEISKIQQKEADKGK